MKLKIKLLSDLCTYSGETYNSVVDTDVTYDKYGIPYISAKRLKGCIREAALDIAQMGMIRMEEFEEVFGKEGNQNAAFTLSNAYIEGYESVVNALEGCSYRDLKSPQNVLNQYTYTRTQTAIHPESGSADENSLRRIRVIKKGLTFSAECNWTRSTAKPEILENAISLVKHIGMSRTRGLGLVEMSLSGEHTEEIHHVLFSKDSLQDYNKITYTIHLKSAMICKSAQGNQAVTEDYIAGGKVLGLLAGALQRQGYQKLLSEGELMVSNAYVTAEGKRCVPAQVSYQKQKDQSFDQNGSMTIKDMLLAESSEIAGIQMTPANIRYISPDGRTVSVETEISYHHQRPSDKSIGRATGEDGSSFYQLAAISPGQSFRGYIHANRTQAEQIVDAVSSMGEVRFGYGRASEFGAVDFTLDSVETEKRVSKKVKKAILTLGADLLLYNEMGVLTTDIRVLEKELRDITGADDLVLSNPYIQFAMIGGYNVTWRRRKPISHVLGRGSTFLLQSDTGFDIGELDGQFIGERCAEGYGELLVKEAGTFADVTIVKSIEQEKDGKGNDADTEIIESLLLDEYERRIKRHVREKLEEKKTEYGRSPDLLNTAMAKLRILFRTERTYADMEYQVAEIAKEGKKELCEKLVELIRPDAVDEAVSTEMREQYKVQFRRPWKEEELFKAIYRIYLAELKYFVKSLQTEGASER